MSEKTKIEWADHTWNPWIGCTKVSPGCANCYAEVSTPSRTKEIKWGKGQPRLRTSANYWRGPVRWNAEDRKERLAVEASGGTWERRRFFPSLCDVWDSEIDLQIKVDFIELIYKTQELDWLLLTKRPENVTGDLTEICIGLIASGRFEAAAMVQEWLDGHPPDHVWIGTSVENQRAADERIPIILSIPACVRFLSLEPLLEGVNLERIVIKKSDAPERGKPDVSIKALSGWHGGANRLDPTRIDWVIVGSESGPKARPCNVEWIESIVAQCRGADVPCFVKQLGANPRETPSPEDDEYADTGMLVPMYRIKHLKGGDPAEWPERLRVREFPGRKEVA